MKAWAGVGVVLGLWVPVFLGGTLPATVSAADIPAEIRIGAAVPMTGGLSKAGIYYKLAYEVAAHKANQKGGIYLKEYGKKLPIKLIVYDNKSDATTAVNLMERLIKVDKVHALMGGYPTNIVFAESVVPEKHKIPYVNSGGAAKEIYQRGFKWIFGCAAPIYDLAKSEMDYLQWEIDRGRLPKPIKIVLAWEKTAHGKDYEVEVLRAAKSHPAYFKIVMNESFALKGSDYSPLLAKVKGAGADVFLADAHLEDYITMHRQYTEMGLYHKMVSYGARGPDTAAKKALGPAADHIFAAVWWSPQLPYPQVKEFVRDFEQLHKQKIEWYAYSYDVPLMLFKGIEMAGSLEPEKIRDALTKTEIDYAIIAGGRLKFEADGQARYPFVVVQGQPGKAEPVIIWPRDAASGEPICPIPKK